MLKVTFPSDSRMLTSTPPPGTVYLPTNSLAPPVDADAGSELFATEPSGLILGRV